MCPDACSPKIYTSVECLKILWTAAAETLEVFYQPQESHSYKEFEQGTPEVTGVLKALNENPSGI